VKDQQKCMQGMKAAYCVPSILDWVGRVGAGQAAGRGPPKQSCELSVGQETGLAPVIPALMSWKQAEMAQHVKASTEKVLPMPAGQERTKQGGNRA
jgi:hypothetical protein